MKNSIFKAVKRFFGTLFFVLGIMVIPILVIDLIHPQYDMVMLRWALLFSALLSFFDILFDELSVFSEKVVLKRSLFAVFLTAVAMGTSWIMGIIETIPVLLSGIAGCAVVVIPTLILLHRSEKKKTEQLNEKLREFNEHSGE